MMSSEGNACCVGGVGSGYGASTHEFFFPTTWEEERSSGRWNLQNAKGTHGVARKELSAAARLFKTNPSRAMLGDFAEMSVKMADRVLVEIAGEQDEIGE